MNATEVASLVEHQARSDFWFLPEHEEEFKRGLVTPPEKRTYEYAFRPGQFEECWLVFEESPEDRSGYKIVYTEGEHGYYGIASGNSISGPELYETPAGFTFVQAYERMQDAIAETAQP